MGTRHAKGEQVAAVSVGDTVKWSDVPVNALVYATYCDGHTSPNIALRTPRSDPHRRHRLSWVWEYYFQGSWKVTDERSGPWDPSYGSSRPSTAVVLALDVAADWSAWQFKRAALDGAKVAGIADELAQDGGPFASGSWPEV